MAEITLPSQPYAQSVQWRLTMPSQMNVSEWTGSRQVLPSGRGWWECNYSLPPIVGRKEFEPWQAFLAKTQGTANTFRVRVDTKRQSPYFSYTVLVNGGSQTGRTIDTDGWPAGTTILRAGQFVTIGDQLLQLTENVTSNGSGEATLTFEPPIRVSPADNAAVEWQEPYCLMYLTEQPFYTGEAGAVFGLSLQLREAF